MSVLAPLTLRTPLTPLTAASRRRALRGGSVYALVLGIAVMVTAVGLGALAAARVTGRASSASDDWNEAGLLAFSACEQAVARVNAAAAASPYAWRGGYTSGQPVPALPLERGTCQWVLVDPGDGNLSNLYTDSIKVYGIGRAGRASRVYSVTLKAGGSGMDVLRTACHANGGLTLSGTPTFIGGPASTNAKATVSVAPRGDVEAASKGGTAVLSVGSIIPAPAKVMPPSALFDYYKSKATTLNATAVSGSIFNPGTLTPTSNTNGSLNPDGVYYLRLPNVSTVQIYPTRLVGTLLIEGNASSTLQTVQVLFEQYWQPARADYPVLMTRDVNSVQFSGSLSRLTLSSGSYPSEFRGLIHLTDTASVILNNAFYLYGSLVAEGTITTSGTMALVCDPKLLSDPPVGYQKGDVLTPVPGSWKWDQWP